MKNLHILLIGISMFGVVNGWGQDITPTTNLTEDEIKTFREIAKYWNNVTLFILLGVALLLPILGFIIARTNFKNWFIPMVGENLIGKKEEITEALNKFLNDFQLRKNTRILVVSDQIGINLPIKNFLEEKGFSFSSIGDGFINLQQFNKQSLGGANLVLFNYLGKDLSVVQDSIGNNVLSLKGVAKVVVAGNERMDPKYKDEMGNYLSFSNGYDTLESRILGAVKQPIA